MWERISADYKNSRFEQALPNLRAKGAKENWLEFMQKFVADAKGVEAHRKALVNHAIHSSPTVFLIEAALSYKEHGAQGVTGTIDSAESILDGIEGMVKGLPAKENKVRTTFARAAPEARNRLQNKRDFLKNLESDSAAAFVKDSLSKVKHPKKKNPVVQEFIDAVRSGEINV